MTVDDAKRIVKARWFDAEAVFCGGWRIVRHSGDGINDVSAVAIGRRCKTEGRAWLAAARELATGTRKRSNVMPKLRTNAVDEIINLIEEVDMSDVDAEIEKTERRLELLRALRGVENGKLYTQTVATLPPPAAPIRNGAFPSVAVSTKKKGKNKGGRPKGSKLVDGKLVKPDAEKSAGVPVSIEDFAQKIGVLLLFSGPKRRDGIRNQVPGLTDAIFDEIVTSDKFAAFFEKDGGCYRLTSEGRVRFDTKA
jgi:hypothetical protein